ncbi:MAG: glycosyltransferase family 2 protein [Acidimicrobiales bacterium]
MSSQVGAVVVNHNAGDHLLDCVASLRAEGLDQVVVADNASTDGSALALTRADPEVRWLTMGANLGFGGAANRGVAACRGDYVLILNPDTVVLPGAVKRLAAALASAGPEVGVSGASSPDAASPGAASDLEAASDLAAVGPQIIGLDGSTYPSARRFPDLVTAIGHGFVGLVKPSNRFTRSYRMAGEGLVGAGAAAVTPVDWLSGSALLVRREAFEAVGGFDERYFMYAEDTDLCWRLARAGWRVGYVPGARVIHAGGISTRRHPYKMMAAHHRSLFRFARTSTRGPARAALPVVAAGLVVRTLGAWGRHRMGRPLV